MPLDSASDNLKLSIAHQRDDLIYRLAKPMEKVANACRKVWTDRKKLNAILHKYLRKIPDGKYLYALNANKIQISDSIAHDSVLTEDFGRDRSLRPYLKNVTGQIKFSLSQAYISLRNKRPSLTAIQVLHDSEGVLLGFIGADFAVRDLPLVGEVYQEPRVWRQIKGDPSIRSGVFFQTRADSEIDQHVDTVLGVIQEIMLDHGVYHVMIHFSSSRAVIWHYDDPYRYHLLDVQSLVDINTCLAFPRRDYPKDVTTPADKISAILAGFRQLRYMDDTLYLRTATLNIFNGVVGLTFSCDGSHYLPYDEFLNKEHALWVSSLM